MLSRRFRVVSRRLQTKLKQRQSTTNNNANPFASSPVAASHVLPRITQSRVLLHAAGMKRRGFAALCPFSRSSLTAAASELLLANNGASHPNSTKPFNLHLDGSKALLLAMAAGALLTGTLALNHHEIHMKEREQEREFVTEHPNLVLQDPSQACKMHYHMYNEIGSGAYATVRLGKCLETGELNAIKILDAKHSDGSVLEREITALRRVKSSGGHHNIIDLQDVYLEGGKLFLVTELVRGGELFDHLHAYGAYDEHSAKWLAKQMVEALCFLHQLGIVHKDIKPENILLASPSSSSSNESCSTSNVVKLVDFGSAGLDHTQCASCMVGTSAYLAPESVTSGVCSFASDVWAFGCVLYVMLTGCHPFDLEGKASDLELMHRIQQQQVDLNYGPLQRVSPEAKELLAKLLDKDPSKRPTADQVLEHPWFQTLQMPTRSQVQLMSKASKPQQRLLNAISGAEEERDQVTSNTNIVCCYCW